MGEVNTTREAAVGRFRAAMDHVEEAQRELGRAAAELSGLRFAGAAWRNVGREYDRVHALWYVLALFLESHACKLDLDECAKAAALMKSAVERAP